MVKDRPARLNTPDQKAETRNRTDSIIEHAVLDSNRDQLMHVKILANGKVGLIPGGAKLLIGILSLSLMPTKNSS